MGDLTAASFEAKDRGARTGILLDVDGCVAEGPGFNVVVVKDGRLASPSRNALPGITRRTVFEIAEAMDVEAVRPLGGSGEGARVCSRVTPLRLSRRSVTLLRCGRGVAS